MMAVHFEELWESCEKLHQEADTHDSAQSIIDELMMKISLYKTIDQKSEINDEERKIIKSRLYGEILLTMTNLSLTDNINVFDALMTAHRLRSITLYSDKYK